MLCVLVAISLSCQGPVQGLDQRVTYACPPTRAEIVLKELSALTGKGLVAGPDLVDAVLVIQVNDVPLETLLDKIKCVAAAEWRRESTVLRLVRTPLRAKELERRDFEKQRDLFERALTALRVKVKQDSQFGSNEAGALLESLRRFNAIPGDAVEPMVRFQQQRSLAERVPIAKLASRIAAQFDAPTLARLPIGQTVYSNAPTRMELALPKGAGEAISETLRQQRVWQKSVEETRKKGVQVTYSGFQLDPTKLAMELPENPLVLVTVARSSIDAPSVSFSATVATSFGQLIPSYGINVANETYGPKPVQPTTSTPNEPKSVEMPAVPRQFYEGPHEFPNDPSAELRALLRSPEHADPLGFTAAGMLPSYAESKGFNLVGCCSDALLNSAYAIEAMTPSEFKRRMESLSIPYGIEWREEEGWLLIQPRLPSLEKFRRFDRKVAGRILKLIDGPWIQSLDEIADLAASLPPGNLDATMVSAMANHLRPTAAFALPSSMRDSLPSFESYDRWKLLRVYGSLDQAQRQAVWNGGLSAANLAPQQRARLAALVYSPSPGLDLRFDPPALSQLLSRPTRALPDGIPEGALIRGTAKFTSVLYAFASAGKAVPMALSKDLPYAWEQPKEALAKLDVFAPMELWVCTIVVELAPGIKIWDNHFFTTAPSGLHPVPVAKLSPEVRGQFKVELERLRSIKGGG